MCNENTNSMDYYTARQQFNNYLKDYDNHNDKIRLKIVHTYGIVKESTDISSRMQLSEEDTTLAKIIGLLHDIGRFEQLKRFDSFLTDTVNHAAYGVKILFNNDNGTNLIRRFVPQTVDKVGAEVKLQHQLCLPSDERISLLYVYFFTFSVL